MKKLITNSIKINMVLLGLFPIMPHLVNVITTVALAILSLLLFISSQAKVKKSKILLINSSLYLVFLISLFYTDNFEYAIKHLLTALSLIVLPLTFYLLKMSNFFENRNLKDIFLKIFWGASVVYSLIVFGSFFTFSNPRYPFKDANFFRKASESLALIGQHPIYSSMILSLAFLMGIYLLSKTTRTNIKNIIFLGQTTIVILLFMLMSRSVIISLMLSLMVFIVFKFKKSKFLNAFYIILGTTFLSIFIYAIIPRVNNRFSQLFKKATYTELNENNSTSIRATIYKCAIYKIKLAPYLGYGFGDVKDELLSCYQNKASFMVKNRYNSHNQYLSIWLGAGLIGLLIFIYMLYYNLKVTLLTSNYLGFSILIFFMGIMFFENILERQTGVILFAFFLNLNSFYGTKKLKTKNQ